MKLLNILLCFLQQLIERRERQDEVASALLAGLSINGERVSSVEEMEWKYGSSGLTRDAHFLPSHLMNNVIMIL